MRAFRSMVRLGAFPVKLEAAMRATMSELGEFFRRFYKHWLSSVGGTMAVIFAFIQDMRGGTSMPFWVSGAIALVIAAFLTWREAYREARPYGAETLEFVRRHWAEQTPESQANLRRLLVEKQIQADAEVDLVRCQFVTRSFQGMYSIIPEFADPLARVAREDAVV